MGGSLRGSSVSGKIGHFFFFNVVPLLEEGTGREERMS